MKKILVVLVLMLAVGGSFYGYSLKWGRTLNLSQFTVEGDDEEFRTILIEAFKKEGFTFYEKSGRSMAAGIQFVSQFSGKGSNLILGRPGDDPATFSEKPDYVRFHIIIPDSRNPMCLRGILEPEDFLGSDRAAQIEKKKMMAKHFAEAANHLWNTDDAINACLLP